ncbi:MAG TPA: DUF2007 domain-containing protein [Longimicrobiales bacterium]
MPYLPAWVILTTCTAVVEAQTTCERLRDAGIAALFRGEHAAYDGRDAAGVARGVDVLVPAGRAEEARALLEG